MAVKINPMGGKGNKRWLWNDQSVAFAAAYVQYDQGEDLGNFDKALNEWKANH